MTEQRERPAVLARDWGLLPKLGEKPALLTHVWAGGRV